MPLEETDADRRRGILDDNAVSVSALAGDRPLAEGEKDRLDDLRDRRGLRFYSDLLYYIPRSHKEGRCRALGITVETRDGVVKLEGEAGSWEGENLVSKRVIDVPGVKMVFNNMTVERIVPPSWHNDCLIKK